MPALIPGARRGWETILLLPEAAAEPAVGRHRARLVESARGGIPAHITVLYPFLPSAQRSPCRVPVLPALWR